jgi:hypothetical protein
VAGMMKKTITMVLTLTLILTSVNLLENTSAQSIAKPSAPKFTLKYIDNSYDVPPTSTSTTDPYTGKIVTSTTPGYRVENKVIEITITNQWFAPYSDSEGKIIDLSYNVRFKGHFGDESSWEEPFYKPIRNGIYGFTKQIHQSNSGYTVISVPSDFRVGDVVDFQVQTLEGFYTPWEPLPVPMGTSQFTGLSSDWSSTQTISIGATSTSVSPSPDPTITPTPTMMITSTQDSASSPVQPNTDKGITLGVGLEQVVIVALAAVIVALVLALVLSRRKRP